MTHTTFAQSNLSVSSAVVNPSFFSMSKRAWESFATLATAKQEAVHCAAMMAGKFNDKDADKHYHAVPPPEHRAGGDSEREDRCQQDSQRVRKLQEHQALGDKLLQKICQVERKFIFVQTLMEKSTSRNATIPRRISSRRARWSTYFTIKYWTVFVQTWVNIVPISRIHHSTLRSVANLRATACGLHLGLQRITKTSEGLR